MCVDDKSDYHEQLVVADKQLTRHLGHLSLHMKLADRWMVGGVQHLVGVAL